jgi:hypothetical protein
VNGGQIIESDSGGIMPARADPPEGAYAFRPNRVDENVYLCDLDEERGVSDCCDSKASYRGVWLDSGARRHDRGPGGSLSKETPAKNIEDAFICGRETSVMELLPVEVIGHRTVVVAIPQLVSS